jgi:hypothetical protein
MPNLQVSVPHSLSEQEAERRLWDRYDTIKTAYAGQIKDFEEERNGNSLRCKFTAYGMKIQSTVTTEPGKVLISLDLPFLAMAFKGLIEKRIRDELGTLLA